VCRSDYDGYACYLKKYYVPTGNLGSSVSWLVCREGVTEELCVFCVSAEVTDRGMSDCHSICMKAFIRVSVWYSLQGGNGMEQYSF